MRLSESETISALVPKLMQCVGHALAQAGCWPTATLSEHKVHL